MTYTAEWRLIDIPLKGGKFTHANLREKPSMARVDRFLITLEWLSQFPNTMQLENMNIISDHIPIELDTGACDFKKSSVYIWKKKYDLKMKKYIILFETNRVKIMEKGHLVKPW